MLYDAVMKQSEEWQGMLVKEAKQEIKELRNYIQLIEGYMAETFEQEALYLYVQLESVSKVADELNKKGYKVGNRKVISKDVSDIIRSKPVLDEMHNLAKKFFSGNKKKAPGRGWM
jgi:phosphopantothenoylcysteine synthetase/decarboxylase